MDQIKTEILETILNEQIENLLSESLQFETLVREIHSDFEIEIMKEVIKEAIENDQLGWQVQARRNMLIESKEAEERKKGLGDFCNLKDHSRPQL